MLMSALEMVLLAYGFYCILICAVSHFESLERGGMALLKGGRVEMRGHSGGQKDCLSESKKGRQLTQEPQKLKALPFSARGVYVREGDTARKTCGWGRPLSPCCLP